MSSDSGDSSDSGGSSVHRDRSDSRDTGDSSDGRDSEYTYYLLGNNLIIVLYILFMNIITRIHLKCAINP